MTYPVGFQFRFKKAEPEGKHLWAVPGTYVPFVKFLENEVEQVTVNVIPVTALA